MTTTNYTNFHEFLLLAFRYAQKKSRKSKVESRKSKVERASRFSLRSKLEEKQPRIARIYTNFCFSHFAVLKKKVESL